MNIRTLLIFSFTLAFSGCGSVSLPTSGITSDGANWTGYFTVQEFRLSGEGVICSGETPMGMAKIQTGTFTCDDGRSGTITTNRQSLRGGIVDVVFSDGTTGKFKYGT